MQTHDVTIVGAGPAGIAASLQLRRFGVDFICLERGEVGGLLRNANLVENYPGFPQGISGPSLVRLMREHLRSLDIQPINESVESITYQDGLFYLVTDAAEARSRYLVIASGTCPRKFTNIDIPAALSVRVLYDVYPLANVANQQIVIVGAGDAAFDYALNLTPRNQVTIINRGQRTRCLPLLWQRVSCQPRIAYLDQSQIKKLEETSMGRLGLVFASPTGEHRVEVDYLIGALGRDPQVSFLPVEFVAAAGNLEDCGLLHWIGDVKNGMERQTAIAVGDGLRAAMKIYTRLREARR